MIKFSTEGWFINNVVFNINSLQNLILYDFIFQDYVRNCILEVRNKLWNLHNRFDLKPPPYQMTVVAQRLLPLYNQQTCTQLIFLAVTVLYNHTGPYTVQQFCLTIFWMVILPFCLFPCHVSLIQMYLSCHSSRM